MTPRSVRLLLVEDSERDAAHIALFLRRSGWPADIRRVETREELLAALGEGSWDAIVCDYKLGNFTATQALELLRSTGQDVPFIVVSGVINDEKAVELMRRGANDYVLKDSLARLPAAIERELEQVEVRRARRRAESMFRAILRASPHPSVIIDRSTGYIVDGSTSFSRQFLNDGAFPGSKRLTSVIAFTQPERIELLLGRGSGTAWYTVYHADGLGHVANVRCYTVDHDGGSYSYILIEDVTEQHYLKAAFDAIDNSVLVIDRNARLLYANHAAELLFQELYFGMPVDPLLSTAVLAPGWWQRPTQRYEQQRIEVKGQPYEATSVAFRFAGESETSTILTLRNIAEEEELQELASHDALTGTFNIRHFQMALERQVELVRAGSKAAIALFDLDHFKSINDQLGHAAGDAALITFANVVRTEMHSSDIFARLGGDEFGLLLPDQTETNAVDVIRRIYERLHRTPLRFDGIVRPLAASCGITNLGPDDSAETVRERADRALYEAKHQGRDRFIVA